MGQGLSDHARPVVLKLRCAFQSLGKFIEIHNVKMAPQIISSKSLGAGPWHQYVLKLPQEILGQLELGTNDLKKCYSNFHI